MGFLISYEEKQVKAKGLHKLAKPNEEKIQQYIFPDDYMNLSLLADIPRIEYSENSVLFYPGCGADVLMPLKYMEILFPRLRKITFVFNDLDNTFGLIKTILDDVGIPFKSPKISLGYRLDFTFFRENSNHLQFYWKGILVDLRFIRGNVFQILHQISAFDIYFERAFRIMKDEHPDYENQVYQKLKHNGILISDSGFQHLPLQKVDVSQELSSYREMIIGVKK